MDEIKSTENLNPTIPSLILSVERSIANFLNQQGNQKLYYLLDSIQMLKNYSIVFFGKKQLEENVNIQLQKIKYKKIKDYEKLDKFLGKISNKLNYATVLYENMKNSKDTDLKKRYEREIAQILSPFQDKLYFTFMIFLKSSKLQDKTISRELLRSPEESKVNTKSFERKRIKDDIQWK
jgi:hypothetical protein